MKRYLFKVELSGMGNNEQEAWEDAVDSFCDDPGEPHETEELSDNPFEGTES